MKKVLIVGAGVVGLNTALQIFLNHGSDVQITVVEQMSEVATQTSFANGGQVSVCNSSAWNTWGNVFKGIKWLFDGTAPLKISGNLTRQKIQWLGKFLSEIKNEAENTNETFEIARKSRALYNEFFNLNAIDLPSLNRNGIYKVYRTAESFDRGVDESQKFNRYGEPSIIRDMGLNLHIGHNIDFENFKYAEMLADLKIGGLASKIVGGVFYPLDFTFNLHEYCVNLHNFLKENGVKFIFNSYIINGFDNLFDIIIYCTGVGVNDIGMMHGVEIDVYPVKGYSVTYDLSSNLDLNTSILDEDNKIVASVFNGGNGKKMLRVAGTAELCGYDYSYSQVHPRIQMLHNWAVEHELVDNNTPFMPYSCLRPMTPKMLPFIRRIAPNKFIHGGHGHLGQTMSMETARCVSQLI